VGAYRFLRGDDFYSVFGGNREQFFDIPRLISARRYLRDLCPVDVVKKPRDENKPSGCKPTCAASKTLPPRTGNRRLNSD
jgi:hypothetical protein